MSFICSLDEEAVHMFPGVINILLTFPLLKHSTQQPECKGEKHGLGQLALSMMEVLRRRTTCHLMAVREQREGSKEVSKTRIHPFKSWP